MPSVHMIQIVYEYQYTKYTPYIPMSGKKEENIQFIWTYIKSFVIVCEPLARALNSTPVKSTDLGCFHSISFPLKQG